MSWHSRVLAHVHAANNDGISLAQELIGRAFHLGETTALMDRPYLYTTLQNTRTIRLLRLPEAWIFLGCECDDPRTDWEFVDVSLDNHPPYLAVSYVWDNPWPTSVLRGRRGNLPLTDSAANVLRYICAEYATPLYIWIDALCIDQQNLAEKRVQLPLMKEIYSEAVQVLAWLGLIPRRYDIRTTLDSPSRIREVRDMVAKDARRVDSRREDPQAMTAYLETTCQCMSDQGSSTLFIIERLISLKWFHRIWIFQEVICGSSIVLACRHELGNETIEILWDDLFHYLLKCNLLHFGPEHQVYGSSNVCVTAARRYLHQHSRPGLSLQTLLTDASSVFDATDPQDRIYALVSLSNDVSLRDLRPAYADSSEAVYTEVTILILTSRPERNQYPFALLSFSGIGRPRILDNLPSWVPDWSSAAHRLAFDTKLLAVNQTHFEKVADRATFDATRGATCTTSQVRTLYGSTVLSVQGAIIDTVNRVGHRYPRAISVPPGTLRSSTWPDTDASRSKAWATECESLAASIAPYPTGESADKVLWRTLIADMRQDCLPWSFVHGHTCIPKLHECETFFKMISGEITGTASFYAPCRCCNFAAAFEMHGAGRVIFTTRGGLLGLGPEGMAIDDELCLLLGARVPFLLRKSDKLRAVPSWSLVGECYVHGIMRGERYRKGDVQVIRMV